jgi:hypothetical protein
LGDERYDARWSRRDEFDAVYAVALIARSEFMRYAESIVRVERSSGGVLGRGREAISKSRSISDFVFGRSWLWALIEGMKAP